MALGRSLASICIGDGIYNGLTGDEGVSKKGKCRLCHA